MQEQEIRGRIEYYKDRMSRGCHCGECPACQSDKYWFDLFTEHLRFMQENEELSQQVCDVCTPQGSGWRQNAVEGKVPCVCMEESEPYQILLERNNELEEALDEIQPVIDILERTGYTGYSNKWAQLVVKAQEKLIELRDKTLIGNKQVGCCGVVGIIINGKCEHCGKTIKEAK